MPDTPRYSPYGSLILVCNDLVCNDAPYAGMQPGMRRVPNPARYTLRGHGLRIQPRLMHTRQPDGVDCIPALRMGTGQIRRSAHAARLAHRQQDIAHVS